MLALALWADVLHRPGHVRDGRLKSSVAKLVDPVDDLRDGVTFDPAANLAAQHQHATGKPPGVLEPSLRQVDLVGGKFGRSRHSWLGGQWSASGSPARRAQTEPH